MRQGAGSPETAGPPGALPVDPVQEEALGEGALERYVRSAARHTVFFALLYPLIGTIAVTSGNTTFVIFGAALIVLPLAMLRAMRHYRSQPRQFRRLQYWLLASKLAAVVFTWMIAAGIALPQSESVLWLRNHLPLTVGLMLSAVVIGATVIPILFPRLIAAPAPASVSAPLAISQGEVLLWLRDQYMYTHAWGMTVLLLINLQLWFVLWMASGLFVFSGEAWFWVMLWYLCLGVYAAWLGVIARAHLHGLRSVPPAARIDTAQPAAATAKLGSPSRRFAARRR